MGLFDRILNKQGNPAGEDIFKAYAKGRLIPISQVNDPTFAEEMLGKGVAILPSEGVVKAPIDGKIAVVFDTKHAIAIVTENGGEILIHIGLDTVQLGGEGFDVKVKVGSKVKTGQIIATFDKEAIEAKGYDTVIPMVVTNSAEFSEFTVTESGEVEDEVVFSAKKQ